jgi:ABC transporter, phosphonate, periplasmic substrate-binding protein
MTSTIIFETFLDPVGFKAYQYITEYVERYVHVPTFLLNGEALDDFSAAYADVGFVSPLAYSWLLRQKPCPVELIAVSVQQGAQEDTLPPAFLDIVTRKENMLDSIHALEGSVWASYTERSHVADHFVNTYSEPAIHYRERIEAPTQVQALHLVLKGLADATAIDVDLIFRNSPQIATQLRILDTYSCVAGPFVVVASHVNPIIRKNIQDALLTIHKESFFAQRLQELGIQQFVSATNAYYQDLCESYRTARAHTTHQQHESIDRQVVTI